MIEQMQNTSGFGKKILEFQRFPCGQLVGFPGKNNSLMNEFSVHGMSNLASFDLDASFKPELDA